MDELLSEVLSHARCIEDKTRAVTASIYSLGSRNKLQEAIDLGLQVMRDLGEPFPTKGYTISIVCELIKTNRMLRKHSDDDILKLPTMRDPKKLASMRIMMLLFAYTLSGRPMLTPLLALRRVQMTIERGLSEMASGAFSSLAMMSCVAFNKVELGIRLARLSLVLLEQFQAMEWHPRVFPSVHGFCFTRIESLSKQLKPLLLSHRTALGSGDIEFAVLSCSLYAGAAMESAAVPLPRLIDDMHSFLGLMRRHKQTNMVQFLKPNIQLVLNMMGRCTNPFQ